MDATWDDDPLDSTSRRLALVAAGTGVLLALVWCALAVRHLHLRPPCTDGSVRLLDLAPLTPYLAGLLGALEAVVAFCSRPAGRHRVAATLAVTLAAPLALGTAATAHLVEHDRDTTVMQCWSF